MRRRQEDLIPIEQAILLCAIQRELAGEEQFHGFAIATLIRAASGARGLTAHGTLYKALARLERAGLLESEWEDPALAAQERRPLRRLYRLSPDGRERAARLPCEREMPARAPVTAEPATG